MLTDIMTFVHAKYALVTFIQISNISAITRSILTKLLGPNSFWVIVLVDQNDFKPNFFINISAIARPILTKLFWPNFFWGHNFCGPNIFRRKFFWDPKCFRAKNIWTINFFGRKKKNFEPEIFRTQIFFTLKNLLGPKFFGIQNSLQKNFPDPKFFAPTIFFEFFFRPKILFKNFLD